MVTSKPLKHRKNVSGAEIFVLGMKCHGLFFFFFLSGKLRCAVIIAMSALLLVCFFSKFYKVDKIVLRAVGLSFQQLPCLPFCTSVACEYTVRSAASFPVCLSTSPLPKACDILEQTPGRGSQEWVLWPESAQGDVSRFGKMNLELREPGGETKSVHTCQRLKGFTSLHFQLLVFYLGKIPFDSPCGELLIPVSGSFFTSIPQRTDFNAWWIQTKLFPFLWLCKSL